MQLLTDCGNPETLIASPVWAAEEKLDGDRRLIEKRGNAVIGYTRNGNEVALPDAVIALAMLSQHAWAIDGEKGGG